jgi:peroxiredoxin
MKKSIAFAAVLLLLTISVSAIEPIKPGDAAPDVKLKNIKGEIVSLSQFEKVKGFIVVFSCNTCPVVKQYEDRIMQLHNEFSSKGFPVIAINSNDPTVSPGDSFEDMKKHAKNLGYKFEYLYDESQDIAKLFGAARTPHAYVLSKEGNTLTVEYMGAIDNNADDALKADKKYVSEVVNALLSGQQVPVTDTKAVGCAIKWKKV